MIKNLKIENIGPADTLALSFCKRLNVLTGDNGLGKSFLLDIVWWSLTRKWPYEINTKLTTGAKARPTIPTKESTICFSLEGKVKEATYTSTYRPKEQAWIGNQGRPINPGLVLYAMSDGSFSVWDPARNYWKNQQDSVDTPERLPAYVFSPSEVWNGIETSDHAWLCNGLIRDWDSWQKENGDSFSHLKEVLSALSPSPHEQLKPGKPTRVSLNDVRDIPTLQMPYGQDVPVTHASSGMRRIIALAYLLVWAWEEHKKAALQIGEKETKQITFLIDEIESHLHPKWQRSIIPALLSVMKKLSPHAEVQLVTATHSPLVMTSIEPLFDPAQDAWFDLDFENGHVVLQQRDFEKHGDAATWLASEAFDLKTSYSTEYEALIEEAGRLIEQENPALTSIAEMTQKLAKALAPTDKFLGRWQYITAAKGWQK